MISKNDKIIMTDLAKRVSLIASHEKMDVRRKLWSTHNSLKGGRPPIYIRDGHWSRETVQKELRCEDEFLRGHEFFLRKMIAQDIIDDDFVIEPWINLITPKILPGIGAWGVEYTGHDSGFKQGAKKYDIIVEDLSDLSILKKPNHEIDEKKTSEQFSMLQEAMSYSIDVNVDRTPLWWGFEADISTRLGYIRGLEQIMWDMYDDPQGLKELLGFMRDGIIHAQNQALKANHFTLGSHINQSMCYIDDLPWPKANSEPVTLDKLWGFSAAQEFAQISPAMHEEFMFNFQIPILENLGHVSYGCCEDLTEKIDMIKQLKNVRRIAISPYSDVGKCAKQLSNNYIASWRPDPATTVCLDFNEERIENILREADISYREYNCPYDICLKDVHTIQGEFDRLVNFVKISKKVLEEYYGNVLES